MEFCEPKRWEASPESPVAAKLHILSGVPGLAIPVVSTWSETTICGWYRQVWVGIVTTHKRNAVMPIIVPADDMGVVGHTQKMQTPMSSAKWKKQKNA